MRHVREYSTLGSRLAFREHVYPTERATVIDICKLPTPLEYDTERKQLNNARPSLIFDPILFFIQCFLMYGMAFLLLLHVSNPSNHWDANEPISWRVVIADILFVVVIVTCVMYRDLSEEKRIRVKTLNKSLEAANDTIEDLKKQNELLQEKVEAIEDLKKQNELLQEQ
ncbi:MAG: hypothetical protein SGILL_003660, partial [Bacillariaceae sp.]